MPKRTLTLIVSAALGVGAAMGVAACGGDDETTTDVIEQTNAPATDGDQGGAPSTAPGVGVDQGDQGGAPSTAPGVGVDQGDPGGAPSTAPGVGN